MSKFFRLCSCEFTKIMKKKSTKVMLIILVISLFASAGLAQLTKGMYNIVDEMYLATDYKESMKSEIETMKTELNNESLDEASKNANQAYLETLQLALDNDINIYTYIPYWKTELLLDDISISKQNLYNYKSIGDEESAAKEQSNIDAKIEILKNDDFSGYIKLQKDAAKVNLDNVIINEQEYNDTISILDLKEKYEIGKTYNSEDSWKATLVDEIQVLKTNIRTGIDMTTGKALTEEGLEKASDTIKMNEYRLEHNMPPFMTGDMSIGTTRKVYDYMMGSLSMMVIAVMIIIIAGSSISSEFSKGTIKFWSFTPNKRWKILLSKLVVNTLILVVTTVGITLVSAVVGNVFFGSQNAQDYIYVSGGTVHTINYIAYSILYNLAMAIDIFMFLLLAMMLSTVARNTAVAVGISIAAYLGGSTIMQILNMFVKSEWIKFIPFNNLTLADRIFTNDVSYSASTLISGLTGNISAKFSLAVLGVCAVIMIVTMFDSFRKRDIAA
ncbi:MAG: ABC transporter permease [Clostridia bacterium]|nr:ABC transporter permease [Clostridia bacterium]